MKLKSIASTMIGTAVILAAGATCAAPPDLNVVEYFHRGTSHYFMTGSTDDQTLLDAAAAAGQFTRTGRSFAAWSTTASGRPAEAVAVVRFFSPALASHVFTSNPKDISALRALPATASGSGFVDEGTAFFALAPVDNRCDLGHKAIFRAFNNRPDGNHRYSNEIELHAEMVKTGFSDDAVAFCSTGVSSDATVEKSAGTPRPSGEDITLSGTVSGFTSIASFSVGTQRVDASNARFDHGSPLALANGLAVTVEGVLVNAVLVATEVKLPASAASSTDEIQGFVTAVGAAGTVFVNGTAVDISSATVTGGTLAQLIVGAEVEIHGMFVDSKFVATLVHIENAAPVSATPIITGEIELRGVISGFVSLASFTVGNQKVDASKAVIDDGTPASLINGATVEVHGAVVSGVIVATRVEVRRAAVTPPNPSTPPGAASVFEATGAISNFVSISSFQVSGATIDASSATFHDGSAADLKNGAVIEVHGTLSGGVVHADNIEIKSTPVAVTPPNVGVEFEATGAVSGFVSLSSFQLSGSTIDASTASFERGTAADLKDGVLVEVHGTKLNGVVKATRVRFEH